MLKQYLHYLNPPSGYVVDVEKNLMNVIVESGTNIQQKKTTAKLQRNEDTVY